MLGCLLIMAFCTPQPAAIWRAITTKTQQPACLALIVLLTNPSSVCLPAALLQATGSYDETIRFWDVRSGRCLRELPAHSDPITGTTHPMTLHQGQQPPGTTSSRHWWGPQPGFDTVHIAAGAEGCCAGWTRQIGHVCQGGCLCQHEVQGCAQQ